MLRFNYGKALAYSSFIRGIYFSKNMGGSKKPTAASRDKASGSRDTKKKKDKGEGGPRKAEITVMVNSKQALKIIQNSKVITAQDLARQTGVKISASNAFLKESVSKGIVKQVGGYSGHYLYQMVPQQQQQQQSKSSLAEVSSVAATATTTTTTTP